MFLLTFASLSFDSIIPHPISKVNRTARISQAALVLFCCSAVFHLAAALVKGGVNSVEILAVEMLLRDAQGIGEFTHSNKPDFPLCRKAFLETLLVSCGLLQKTYEVKRRKRVPCFEHIFLNINNE